MEQLVKSCRKDRVEDRLSSLPDSLIHQIFTFLDIGAVARTSSLAKRWRYLWLSTPVLNFSLSKWLKYVGRPRYDHGLYIRKVYSFLDLVDKMLLEDSRNVFINKLDLKIDEYIGSFKCSRVNSWVLAALIRNVHHIRLKFPVSKPLELPHQMFTPSSNLEILELHPCSVRDYPHVRLPSSLYTAPRIKRLILHKVLFPNGDVNGELVLTCPLLENLELNRCDVVDLKILTISTPRLETLELTNVFTNEEASCKVKTHAPNLQELNIHADRDLFIVEYFMEDLSSLVSTNIDVNTNYEDDVRKKMWSKSLIGILSKVHNLQSLRLSSTSVQILTDISELLQKVPNLFPNLKYVMLEDPCKARLPILSKIMGGFPRVESFAWSSCLYFKHELWTEELSFDCRFHHLKSITIDNIADCENDIMFLELLLRNATVLENVRVTNTKGILELRDLEKLDDMLQTLPRASSTVIIDCWSST